MSYIINNTNGDALVTVVDGTTDTNFGLTLIGRNFTSYGEIQNENFIRILENFASDEPPGVSPNSGFVPLAGQLWWDTANQRLTVYNGTDFIPSSEQTVSATAPTVYKLGDQWYDTTDKQFKIYNGTAWHVIAPGYTAGQGKSGAIVETIVDTTAQSHTVVNTYTNGNLITVTSHDATFTPNAILFSGNTIFSNIQPGINVATGAVINGTASNSNTVGGIYANAFARSDISTTFSQDLAVTKNIVLTNANIYFSDKSLILQNKNLSGNIDFFVNTPTVGNARPMVMDGSTGLVYVKADPTSSLGVATKGYVDTIHTDVNANLISVAARIDSTVQSVYANLNSDISDSISSASASLTAVNIDINSNVTTLSGSVDARFASIRANVTAANAAIVTANLGMKGYVDSVTSAWVADSLSQAADITALFSNAATQSSSINNEISARNAAIANAILPLATIASPTFTGAPVAPTPSAGDNSTRVATTGFVTQAISAQKFNYTVSSGPPSGGNDGDFWFQVG